MAQENKSKETFYKGRYGFLVSLFAGIAMSIQFLFHNLSIGLTLDLLNEFRLKYPTEMEAFNWVNQTSTPLSLYMIILIGLLTSLIVFLIIVAFHELGRYEMIGHLIIDASFLLIFVIFGFLLQPVILQRPLNLVWAFGFSIVCGASSHLLLIHDKLKEKRRATQSKPSSKVYKKELLKQTYLLEHAEYGAVLQNIVWICVFLSAGLVFSAAIQFFFSFPLEITLSNKFGMWLGLTFVKFAILLIGVILGVIRQIAHQLHDIVELMRKQAM